MASFVIIIFVELLYGKESVEEQQQEAEEPEEEETETKTMSPCYTGRHNKTVKINCTTLSYTHDL